MKTINKYIIAIAAMLMMVSCYDGIDPITEVDPGSDLEDPTAQIVSPNGDVLIPFTDTELNLDIEVLVEDDIEINNVTVILDGNTIQTFDSFLDYRIFMEAFQYENLQLGSHTIVVEATDTSGKTATDSLTFSLDNTYLPTIEGEIFYMPFFEGLYTELISESDPTVVGSPSIVSGGYSGSAYEGATDSYLTFPLDDLFEANTFSATFWYKVNSAPDRAGILVVGNDVPENRNQGFRLFREGSDAEQTIKANIGVGDGESWNDGGAIDATAGDWVHVALTVSATESKIYLNGVLQNTTELSSSIDWTGCTDLTIGSGGETFSYWGHESDSSLIDELKLFNTALSQADIDAMQPEDEDE
ncbi:LamG domain-containing protein [Winogradskyella sp. SM1960]|uniref:LamG domain-containing protein n=1 Tax=Winogradskyella sp. SM1960 TaxID=2865955 RepID=UPI001CD60C7B|nr:LamG domain-containing protein [Winogradskyella sp. SM1960]